MSMRDCDIDSLKKNGMLISPKAMDEALRRNVLYHKEYNPHLDSKMN